MNIVASPRKIKKPNESVNVVTNTLEAKAGSIPNFLSMRGTVYPEITAISILPIKANPATIPK